MYFYILHTPLGHVSRSTVGVLSQRDFRVSKTMIDHLWCMKTWYRLGQDFRHQQSDLDLQLQCPMFTLPEINLTPECQWLEDEIPFWDHRFCRGELSGSGSLMEFENLLRNAPSPNWSSPVVMQLLLLLCEFLPDDANDAKIGDLLNLPGIMQQCCCCICTSIIFLGLIDADSLNITPSITSQGSCLERYLLSGVSGMRCPHVT